MIKFNGKDISYSKDENDTLFDKKRTWRGGLLQGGISIFDWANQQIVPTEVSCGPDILNMPYNNHWMIQLSVFPEAGWKLMIATCILTGEIWQTGCNVGTWYSWRKIIDNLNGYGYGTQDLTAGVSPLETGKLYFVYE